MCVGIIEYYTKNIISLSLIVSEIHLFNKQTDRHTDGHAYIDKRLFVCVFCVVIMLKDNDRKLLP